jgi:hypothetical protein
MPLPAPTDGRTYAGILDNKGIASTYVAQDLCATIPAGSSASFKIDAARVPQLKSSLTADATNGTLQVWGGAGMCGAGDSTQGGVLLWTSPGLQTDWHTYCVTITPLHDMTALALRPLADYTIATATEVLVDHIVPVASCE